MAIIEGVAAPAEAAPRHFLTDYRDPPLLDPEPDIDPPLDPDIDPPDISFMLPELPEDIPEPPEDMPPLLPLYA